LQSAAVIASCGTDGFLFVFKDLCLGKATFFAHETRVGKAALPILRSVPALDQLSVGEEFMPSIARCAVRNTAAR